MITFRKKQFCAALFAALLAVPPAGNAAEQDPHETYKVFLTRNPFGLKDPPPPPKPAPVETVEPELPSDVKICGMRSLRGEVMVMFASTPPGEETEFVSIVEGSRRAGIEVLEGGVDIEKGTVRVKVQGTERTLSIKEDGYEGGAAKGARTPKPTLGNRINSRPAPVPPPTNSRIPSPPSFRAPPSRSNPKPGFSRPMRTPGNRTQPLGSIGGIPSPTAGSTIRLNAGGQVTSVNPPAPTQTMNAEDQEIVMRLTDLDQRKNPTLLEVAPGKFIEMAQPPLPPSQR